MNLPLSDLRAFWLADIMTHVPFDLKGAPSCVRHSLAFFSSFAFLSLSLSVSFSTSLTTSLSHSPTFSFSLSLSLSHSLERRFRCPVQIYIDAVTDTCVLENINANAMWIVLHCVKIFFLTQSQTQIQTDQTQTYSVFAVNPWGTFMVSNLLICFFLVCYFVPLLYLVRYLSGIQYVHSFFLFFFCFPGFTGSGRIKSPV